MRLILQVLSLSDRYERKARLLPGLVAASPAALTAAALSAGTVPWYAALGVGVGAEALLAFLFGYLARARGKAAEERMWAEWGGPPTTRWLRPADPTCSDPQKSQWRGAIKRVTGLTIPASVTADRTEADIDKVTNDAVRQLRHVLRDRPEAAMVRIHNEDYGQARNLLGLRWHWAGIAALSLIACIVLLFVGQTPWLGLALSGGSLLLALAVGQRAGGARPPVRRPVRRLVFCRRTDVRRRDGRARLADEAERRPCRREAWSRDRPLRGPH
jgi:hypothetical protein